MKNDLGELVLALVRSMNAALAPLAPCFAVLDVIAKKSSVK